MNSDLTEQNSVNYVTNLQHNGTHVSLKGTAKIIQTCVMVACNTFIKFSKKKSRGPSSTGPVYILGANSVSTVTCNLMWYSR